MTSESPPPRDESPLHPGIDPGEPEHPDWVLCESGTYRYRWAAGRDTPPEETGVVERYVRYRRCPGDRQHIRVVRDARASPAGLVLRVDSWEEGGAFTRLALALHDGDERVRASVAFEIGPTSVQVIRARPGAHPERHTLALPEVHSWLPLTRNFLGPVVCGLAAQPGGRGAVVVPELRDPYASDVFNPLIETREAASLERLEESLVEGGGVRQAQAYRFLGGPYDAHSIFWVCRESQRLLRYRFSTPSGEQWSCALTDLAIEK